MDMAELYREAQAAANEAYAPYSHFRVGAALLGENGKVYRGCNVENRSFGLTVCAERNALFSAIVQGQRSFLALAIATPDSEDPVGPCGACRQVLSEFLGAETPVFFKGSKGEGVTTAMGALLPFDSLHGLNQD